MKKTLVMLLAGFAAAAALVACGSSSSPAATVAGNNVSAPVSATTVAAAANVAFSFPAGVPDLGTTGTTTVAFTSTGTAPSFKIDNAAGTATGATAFGSCIFQITSSTFPASHPLAANKTVTINPCTLNLASSGAPADGTSVQRNETLQLGIATSTGTPVTVTISSTGAVTVNGASLGTATLTQVSG